MRIDVRQAADDERSVHDRQVRDPVRIAAAENPSIVQENDAMHDRNAALHRQHDVSNVNVVVADQDHRLAGRDRRKHARALECRWHFAFAFAPESADGDELLGRQRIHAIAHRDGTGSSTKPATLLMSSSRVIGITAWPATILKAALAWVTARTMSSALRAFCETRVVIHLFA